MEKPKKIPLVSGLIGREAQSIHAQLEISRVDYDTINIALKRKAYSGLPDIEFSVADTELQEIIDILQEAQNKIDSNWLSKIATPEVQKEKK
jgi:hypothetical protein